MKKSSQLRKRELNKPDMYSLQWELQSWFMPEEDKAFLAETQELQMESNEHV